MAKSLKIEMRAEDVTAVNISKYKDGYNYASISARPGAKKAEASCGCVETKAGCDCDTEYLNISYEWKGNAIPDVVMDIMAFVQSEKAAIDVSIEEKAETWAEYSAKKKGKNPFVKDDEEDMTDEEKQKMKDKKSKKEGK